MTSWSFNEIPRQDPLVGYYKVVSCLCDIKMIRHTFPAFLFNSFHVVFDVKLSFVSKLEIKSSVFWAELLRDFNAYNKWFCTVMHPGLTVPNIESYLHPELAYAYAALELMLLREIMP